MNWFDLTVGILLLIAFIHGYRKGLIMQVVGLATLVLAAIFGGRLAGTILPEINRLIDLSPQAARVLSFILAFAAIAIALSLVGRILQRFIGIIFLSLINRLLGAVIATGTMMVFLSIILNLALMLDHNGQLINKKTKEESFFFNRVEAVIPAIVPYLQPQLWEEIIPEKYREEIEKKSEPIDSAYPQLHFNI
ncbi:CvpA family protein [Proteiniphilum sp. X52]|uniref:CvpA family protein n=1 Tax=Proteiniphilum sp. X52 TaxID=2382159 RepID=UPI000F0A196C|nr:CvpA family protein [Proteiniphilum sp. X52]RNC66894.1 CvpA family protein [Proteiniphilum sp. X52]